MSGSTSSEAFSQLGNHFIKERRILIVDWSNVVQTSQSRSLFRVGARLGDTYILTGMTNQSATPDNAPKPTNKKKDNSDQLTQTNENVGYAGVYDLEAVVLLVVKTEY